MCGAFGTDTSLRPRVKDLINIDLLQPATPRLRPTDQLSAIIHTPNGLALHQGAWGIKPAWSKKLLINAQAETVAIKKTFKKQYENSRCLIPMSFWYETQKDPSTKNVVGRYKLSATDNRILWMAGIYYSEDEGKIVTLTIDPAEEIAHIHDRMPLLIHDRKAWLREGEVHRDEAAIYRAHPA